MYTVSLRIGHSQERLWHTAQWQGGQHTSIASGPVLLPSAPAAARGVLHLASAGRAARPRAARPRAARSCVATLAPLPMRSRSTPQHTHVLVLHASRPRLVGSCAAQAEGRHTLRGRQREKRAIARNAGKQVRSVAPSQEGVSTGGGTGHHVRGRGVGFSQSDVLICHRLGFDFAAFRSASEASRAFCAACAIFYDFSSQKLEKLEKVAEVSSKKTKTIFDML